MKRPIKSVQLIAKIVELLGIVFPCFTLFVKSLSIKILGTLQKRLTVISGMERSGFPETNIQLQFREIRFTPFPKQLFITFARI